MGSAARLFPLVALLVVFLAAQSASSLRIVRLIKYPTVHHQQQQQQYHHRSSYAYSSSYPHFLARGRPSRPFPRSFRVSNDQGRQNVFARAGVPVVAAAPTFTDPEVIILKNDSKAVPFTVVKSALSTAEFEANPVENPEEGVGPAAMVEGSPAAAAFMAPFSEDNGDKMAESGNSPKDLNVEFSDVHAVYVKPPSDFKPVIYANRRLDGVRSISGGSVLGAPLPPYPYPYPRGLSAWTLGGTRSVQRGSYWEAMASDAALGLPPVYEVSSRKPLAGSRRRTTTNKRKSVKPAGFSSWMVFPGNSNNHFKQQARVPSAGLVPFAYQPAIYAKRIIVPAYRHPLIPQSRRKVVVAAAASPAAPSAVPVKPVAATSSTSGVKSSSSSSDTAIRTKLPVGLTSWMFGGVRDLTGKHWNMPELAVDKVDSVVPVASNDPNENKRDFFGGRDLMMSGDVETFEPAKVTPVFAGEVDESSSSQTARPQTKPFYTNVFFDDEPDNFNSVSVE